MAVDPDTWFSARLGADDDVPAAAAPREERALVSRAIRRDDAALGAIYARHAPAIQRFLRDLVGCPAAAADATQETFVRAFRRIDTLRDEDRLTPWLFGIARNVALEVQKARRVRAR
ncbi:MAG TPA: RNA polymerase sigma factor, partial [Minicystis sp.]|nr:RNA polymerase sigma factor [Minicystis sp.]